MPVHSEISNPSSKQSFDPPSFQKLVQEFLLEGSYRNLSPHTLEFYYFHLLGFQRYLSAQNEVLDPSSFSTLVSEMLNDMSDQGRANKTILGRYNTCRLFFRFLYPE